MPKPAVLMVLVGSAFVLATGVGAALFGKPALGSERLAPQALAGLSLVESKTGEAAEAEVRQMHGQDFVLASAVVARYGMSGEATLWIAQATTEEQATGLVQSMHDRIAAGDSPFTPFVPTVIEGVTVYPLSGLGQEHMYFQAGRSVIWLAVDAALAEEARRAVVEAYR